MNRLLSSAGGNGCCLLATKAAASAPEMLTAVLIAGGVELFPDPVRVFGEEVLCVGAE